MTGARTVIVSASDEAGRGKMDEDRIREALDRHWAASDANDFDAEHEIYREDAVLDYPQSGERIRGTGQYPGFPGRATEFEALHRAPNRRQR